MSTRAAVPADNHGMGELLPFPFGVVCLPRGSGMNMTRIIARRTPINLRPAIGGSGNAVLANKQVASGWRTPGRFGRIGPFLRPKRWLIGHLLIEVLVSTHELADSVANEVA